MECTKEINDFFPWILVINEKKYYMKVKDRVCELSQSAEELMPFVLEAQNDITEIFAFNNDEFIIECNDMPPYGVIDFLELRTSYNGLIENIHNIFCELNEIDHHLGYIIEDDSMRTLLMKPETASIKAMYNFEAANNLLDSGINLLFPEDIIIPPSAIGHTINFKVACQPLNFCHGYDLRPRSSIGKTPLILSNSIGLIDYGYRGNLMVKVHNLSNKEVVLTKGTSLFQLSMPDLSPNWQIMYSPILTTSKRGINGYGSTDKKI